MIDIHRTDPPRWIITGGAGFLGTNLLHALKETDGEVVVVDRQIPRWKVDRPWIRYEQIDIDNVDEMRRILCHSSIVIHMISSSYPGKDERGIEANVWDNVSATVQLAQLCSEVGVRSFVYLSSGGTVYGNQSIFPIKETTSLGPISAYGAMKLSIEYYLGVIHHLRKLSVAVLRISNPFGSWHQGMGQGAINVFLRRIIQGELIDIWGDGRQIRDYISVRDVSEAIRQVGLCYESGFEVFNVGTGIGRELQEILGEVEKVAGKKIQVNYYKARGVDVEKNILDSTKMKEWFGWSPSISFLEELNQAYEWTKKNA